MALEYCLVEWGGTCKQSTEQKNRKRTMCVGKASLRWINSEFHLVHTNLNNYWNWKLINFPVCVATFLLPFANESLRGSWARQPLSWCSPELNKIPSYKPGLCFTAFISILSGHVPHITVFGSVYRYITRASKEFDSSDIQIIKDSLKKDLLWSKFLGQEVIIQKTHLS